MPLRHPTPGEVLSIFVDQHRNLVQFDPEGEPDVVLTFDSSIDDWRFACDLLGWRALGRALNEEWGMSLGAPEWRALLEPSRQRTLRGLCEAISCHAQIETFPEVGLLGCLSPDGRALRALRVELLRLGVSRNEIRRTTLVSPLLSRFGPGFLTSCSRLAPGVLPTVQLVGRVHRWLSAAAVLLFLATWALLIIFLPLGIVAAGLFVLCRLLIAIPHPVFQSSLVLPGIDTLGELATCLAKGMDGEQARKAPPGRERHGLTD